LETGLRLSLGSEGSGNPSETPPAAESASRENVEAAERATANAGEHAEGQDGSLEKERRCLHRRGTTRKEMRHQILLLATMTVHGKQQWASFPPGVDPEVFNSLPVEMQRDCVAQYNATQELAAQLDGSSLAPEALAALPEDMRR
jgi:hypothetical protein